MPKMIIRPTVAVSLAALLLTAAVAGRYFMPSLFFPVRLDASSHQAAIASIDRMRFGLNRAQMLELDTALIVIAYDSLPADVYQAPSFNANEHTYSRLKTLAGLTSTEIVARGSATVAAAKQRTFMANPPPPDESTFQPQERANPPLFHTSLAQR